MSVFTDLYAIGNHFSTPDARASRQRPEQSAVQRRDHRVPSRMPASSGEQRRRLQRLPATRTTRSRSGPTAAATRCRARSGPIRPGSVRSTPGNNAWGRPGGRRPRSGIQLPLRGHGSRPSTRSSRPTVSSQDLVEVGPGTSTPISPRLRRRRGARRLGPRPPASRDGSPTSRPRRLLPSRLLRRLGGDLAGTERTGSCPIDKALTRAFLRSGRVGACQHRFSAGVRGQAQDLVPDHGEDAADALEGGADRLMSL